MFNNIKKSIFLTFITVAFLGLSSCEKYFGDVNVDPNSPLESSPAALLGTIEAQLTYTMGGDFSRFASILTQHIEGADRQFAGYQAYIFVPGDFGTAWSNLYAGVLADIKKLKESADKNGNNHYGGVARALEAYALMMVADFFGDAPYSDALNSEKTLQPAYDTQAKLYETVFALLTEARTKLAATGTAAGALKPGATDIIYGGSTAKWTKFCNVLAARGYLHLGKVDAGNYSKALAELAKGGFASGADDALFHFLPGDSYLSAPWYQYNSQRQDNVINPKYVAMLTTLNDPRKAILGEPLDTDHPLLTEDQAVGLLTFTEQKFIEAECKAKLATPDLAGAKTAMLAGIQSSFDELGLTAAQYTTYTTQASVNPATATLAAIMTQKYIALFVNPEVFNDWRRTGLPALTPNAGTFVPRRFLYPQTELDLNSNTPKGIKLSDRVNWDK